MNVHGPCIARLVNLDPPVNNNRLVSVGYPCVCDNHHWEWAKYGPMWHCETLQTVESLTIGGTLPAGFKECIPDKYLRPLPPHDDAGVDEVIRRVGLPEQHESPIGVINSVLRDLGFERVWP